MDDIVIDKKYIDHINDMLTQIPSLIPDDINELQKNYLIKNVKKSSYMMAQSIQENEEFQVLSDEKQFFYIQVLAEWSFHKEIDLFRSGIPAKYWKTVMQKIWYTCWEVMYACVKNDSSESVVLSLVERFINRTYNEAIDELKQDKIIDTNIEEQAKKQSNIKKMVKEYKIAQNTKNYIKRVIKSLIISLLIGILVIFIIMKFKWMGLSVILTGILVYIITPCKE